MAAVAIAITRPAGAQAPAARTSAAPVARLQPALAQPPPQPLNTETVSLTLEAAIAQARTNSLQLRAAQTAANLAAEDRVQSRAGLLPSMSGVLQYIYTQPNGTPSGVFVPNDGPNVYYAYGTVHADLISPVKWAEYKGVAAAEAAAKARADVAARGLVATVVQDYYAMVAAIRKAASARQGLTESQQFLDITQRQEQGGEVAHSDVVKAQIQVAEREREAQDAELATLKSRLALSVLVFPDYRENFTVVDDLQDAPPVPPLETLQAMATENNPDLKAAEASVQQESAGVTSARNAYLPSVAFDYWYGIQANQFAVYNPQGNRLLGSAASIQLAIPVWNWGATQSKLRQAGLRLNQAQAELSLSQRQLLANISTFYAEAQVARNQVASLQASLDLASESLRLTTLRYQAGEVSVLEVVDAQSTLIQARNAFDDGLVRYRTALASLQTLSGTL
jgi:outer membrane protein TolC